MSEDFSGAVAALRRRFPDLSLPSEDEIITRDRAVELLKELLLVSNAAVPATLALRAVALTALSELSHDRGDLQPDRLAAALLAAFRALPHLEGVLTHHFEVAPSPLAELPADNASARRLVQLVLHALRTSDSLRRRWGWGNLAGLLTHPDPTVRWCACQGLAEASGLPDTVARRLEASLLSETERAECQMAWQHDEAQLAVERSARTSVVSDPPARPPSSGRKRKMTTARSSMYADVGGIELPSRGEAPSGLVLTKGIEESVRAVAMGLCLGSPVLLEGPPGSGKTAAIRHLAAVTGHQDDILYLHLDDQMDAKSLMGTYVCTSRPGEFAWQPGPLTQAVVQGRWVVIEDINVASADVLAALIPLAERRMLRVSQLGQDLRASTDFALFATVTSAPAGAAAGAYASSRGAVELLGGLFHHVYVEPPGIDDQQEILRGLYPALESLLPLALESIDVVRLAFRQTAFDAALPRAREAAERHGVHRLDVAVGRHFGLRDALKWCSRMDAVHATLLARSAAQLRGRDMPLPLRVASFAEALDCLSGLVASGGARVGIARALADVWGLPSDDADAALLLHRPVVSVEHGVLCVGRARVPRTAADVDQREASSSFAYTSHALRLMERVAVSVVSNEPILLVGESGVGKTTVVQQIAKQAGANVVVLNLSQQTDSSDLLGGFRPTQPAEALRPLLGRFGDLVVRTWRKGKNAEFVARVQSLFDKKKLKKVVKAFAAAIEKVGIPETGGTPLHAEWRAFRSEVASASAALAASLGGFAFSFVEGALVRALQDGSWLLLDEVNLAPPEALERIAGLLDGPRGSLVLTERGDGAAVVRHEGFRLFAAMNPATDAGKRDLPSALRNHFTEFWVSEPTQREDLAAIVDRYVSDVDTSVVDGIVDFYQAAKREADSSLQDGAGHRPAYNLRTLCRALEFCAAASPTYGLARSLAEGLDMSFATQLDQRSASRVRALIGSSCLGGRKVEDVGKNVGKAPSGDHVLFEGFWIETGPQFDATAPPPKDFIATPAVRRHLANLSRALVLHRYPVLLQGPTSSGKTSLVAHMARCTGHGFVRINNHEQTDLQEYVGRYVSDETGRLVFREGLLVQAMRRGDWVVLDELNLAPTEVLEALNRLLDDNRELYVAELQETIKPHPHFMLFATQNPPGIYAGRKTLSRAFRSRFLELQVDEIPENELEIILEKRCLIPKSYARKMVVVMHELQRMRSGSNIFAGRHGFITPRDLFRWADRHAASYEELAEDGFLVLGERLRSAEERQLIKGVLKKQLNVKNDVENVYERARKDVQAQVDTALASAGAADGSTDALIRGMVWTRPMLRMYDILRRCLEHSEPVLLVGETGTGKTTVCQTISFTRGQRLRIINCNQHTESSDFLGGFRPNRTRDRSMRTVEGKLEQLRGLPFLSTEEIELFASRELSPKNLAAVAAALPRVSADLKARVGKDACRTFEKIAQQLRPAIADARVPFRWVDGPVVQAMKNGDIVLVDELNLADDSVLERLNSVLEPSRTVTLAEKGEEVVVAHPAFRIVATMNPGGDYGKKELSPALSNRFTSVWIPALGDENDLRAILQKRLDGSLTSLLVPMLAFWRYFNDEIARPAHQVLSVRDLLAWVDFVNARPSGADPLLALAHGAQLVFLDGLGLGVGLSVEVAAMLREKCWRRLLELLDASEVERLERAVSCPDEPSYGDGVWGVAPFEVPVVGENPARAQFDFSPLTIRRNCLRVLRAMQLPRAILLEGSPGVGKTSLVSAIAKAAGRTLVRINLSEQTDMMDLLGADLPVEGSSGEFAWADGPLLHALKNGHWVLLDELNLANQTVLEGLNALLDHRAEVYVPELDRTFRCPPTFRLFGAQNPVQEGGGRKGLPKSFLNRFARVHVELLARDDLLRIGRSMHPALAPATLERMVNYLERIQGSLGNAAGGPWEFNLRDLLRWCELVVCHFGGAESSLDASQSASLDGSSGVEDRGERRLEEADADQDVAARRLADVLFVRRLRSPRDRATAQEALREVWGVADDREGAAPPDVLLDAEVLRVGWAHVSRGLVGTLRGGDDSLALLQSQKRHLEALAHAAQLGWMGILVGPRGVGKSSVVRVLAQLAERPLVELALTPGTDTSDLLGGFEQSEQSRAVAELGRRAAAALASTVAAVVLLGDADVSTRLEALGQAAARLEGAKRDGESRSVTQEHAHLVKQAEEIAVAAAEVARDGAAPSDADAIAASAADLATALQRPAAERDSGCFEWVDGPLTRAVESGHWVLLHNANLCNPTVLDRLNALLEPGGTLQLSECGSKDGLRTVVPHPDFRIFLVLDPAQGEVSRAMRNRGVEVYLEPADPTDENARTDLGSLAAHAGIVGRTREIVVRTHASLVQWSVHAHRPPPSVRLLRHWAELAVALASRGWNPAVSLRVAFQQLYERKAAEEQHLNSDIWRAYEEATEGVGDDDVQLAVPGAWPVRTAVREAARDAVGFSAMRDGCGLLGALALGPLAGVLPWLPTTQSLRLVRGLEVGADRPVPQHVDDLALWALRVIAERRSAADVEARAAMLPRLLVELAAPPLLVRVLEVILRHPLQAATLNAQQSAATAGGFCAQARCLTASGAARALVPQLRTRGARAGVSSLMHASELDALVTVALENATLLQAAVERPEDVSELETLLEVSFWRQRHAKDRGETDGLPPMVDWIYPLLVATQSCELAALELSNLTPETPEKIRCLQLWRARLFDLVGSPNTSSVRDPNPALFEHALFVWLRLAEAARDFLSSLDVELPQSVELRSAVDSMDACLGLSCGQAAEPLLWRFGGHPLMSNDAETCAGLEQVWRLAGVTAALDGEDITGRACEAMRLALGWPTDEPLAGADSEISDEVVLFGLSCDVQLRERLAEALNLLGSAIVLRTTGAVSTPATASAVRDVPVLLRAFIVEHIRKGTDDGTWSALALPRRELEAQMVELRRCLLERQVLTFFGRHEGVLSLPPLAPKSLLADAQRLARSILEAPGVSVGPSAPLLELAAALEAEGSLRLDPVRRLRLERGLGQEAWCRWLESIWRSAQGPSALVSARLTACATALVKPMGGVALRFHEERQQQLRSATRLLLAGPGSAATATLASLWRCALFQAAVLLEVHARDERAEVNAALLEGARWLREGGAGTSVEGCATPAELTTRIVDACAGSGHVVLQAIADSTLRPALQALLAVDPNSPDRGLVGRAWALLALARFLLLLPPPTGDPAAESAFEAAHLEHVSSRCLEPELCVRHIFAELPGGSSEAVRIAELDAKIAKSKSETEELRSRCTARPPVPQYAALREEVLRFQVSVMNPKKVLAVLEASTLRSGAADELVSTLRESVRGWALSTEDLFPMYRDLLQPLRCASLELLTGLELLRGESDVGISRAIAALVAFPRSLHAADLNEGSIGRVVASMGRREGVDPLDVLVSEMRLNLLRLHESVSSARRSRRRSASTSWWLPVHAVFASFVGLWQRVVEEEERIAQEEAQFIKTKALEIEMDPDEKDYQDAFPAASEAFADLCLKEDEDVELGTFKQEAGEAVKSKNALMGRVLGDLVHLHRDAFLNGVDWSLEKRFETPFEIGSELLSSDSEHLDPALDDQTWTGQLLASSMELRATEPKARASRAGTIDFNDAHPEEATLVCAPLAAFRARLAELLKDWPEHPILLQLDAIAQRILDLRIRSSLKHYVTGLELLLTQVQAWQETAAKHVSLEAQMGQLLALALRWRRLELEGWRSYAHRAQEKIKWRAQRGWFHLYRILLGVDPTHPGANSSVQEIIPVLEEFLQSSPLGEFEPRLMIMEAFARQLCDGDELAALSAPRSNALGLAVKNVCRYHAVFLPKIREAIAAGMKDFEKQAADFATLAKWEDRGYYALRTSIEKSQRHLHKLGMQISQLLTSPCSAVLQAQLSVDITTAPPIEEAAADGKRLGTGPVFEWAQAIDEMAGTIAQEASSLAKDGERGHVSRKRASLKFMFDALIAAGFSKSEVAVPQELRAFGSWLETVPIADPEQWSGVVGPTSEILPAVSTAAKYYNRGIVQARILQQAAISGMHADLPKEDAPGVRSIAMHIVYASQRAHGALEDVRVALASSEAASKALGLLDHAAPDLRAQSSSIDTRVLFGGLCELVAEQRELFEALDIALVGPERVEAAQLDAALGAAGATFAKSASVGAGTIVELSDGSASWRPSLARLSLEAQAGLAEELAKLRRIPTSGSLRTLWDEILRQLENRAAVLASASPSLLARRDVDALAPPLPKREARDEPRLPTLIEDDAPLVLAGVAWGGEVATKLRADGEAVLREAIRALAADCSPAGVDVLTDDAEVVRRRAMEVGAQFAASARALSKLALVACSVLSTLARRGFCRPEGEDAEFGEAEKPSEGTGMGEGDTQGAKDVSDELHDQDQLLTNDQSQGKDDEQDGQDADNKSQGVEMDDDFDGNLENVEQSDQSENEDEGEDEGRLDQQMGDVGNEGDVVDEKKPEEDSKEEAKKQETEEKSKSKGTGDEEFAAGDLDEQQDAHDDEGEGEGEKDSEQPKSGPEEEPGDEADEEEGGDENQDDVGGMDDLTSGVEPAVPELELPEDLTLEDGDDQDEGCDAEEGGEDAEGADDEPMDADAPEVAAPEDENSQPDDAAGDEDQSDAKGNQGSEEEGAEDAEATDGLEDMPDATVPEDGTPPPGEAPETDAEAGAPGAGQGEAQAAATEGAEDEEAPGGNTADEPLPGGTTGISSGRAGDSVVDGGNSGDGGMPQPRLEANPLRNLGLAVEQWRRDIKVVAEGAQDVQGGPKPAPEAGDENQEHRYLDQDEDAGDSDAQALGDATEDQAARAGAVDEDADEAAEAVEQETASGAERPEAMRVETEPVSEEAREEKRREQESSGGKVAEGDDSGSELDEDKEAGDEASAEDATEETAFEPDAVLSDRVDDLSLADVAPQSLAEVRAMASATGGDARPEDIATGLARWKESEAAVAGLVGELTEQLRLILEPTLASRLAGEYRSGKRLNMKKVIAYIASQFRKDKIWLRRTQPDKRRYQVLLAIDNSLSMTEMGCAPFALQSLALISRSMNRLEVGEFGVISFGGSSGPQYLHGLDRPFTDMDGVRIMSKLNFDDDNTIQDRPVVDVLTAIDGELERARARQPSVSGSSLQQLVLIVADGRLHEKDSLRRIVRDVTSKPGALYAFILVDNPKSSLLDMKTVSFQGGKPVFTNYMDSFPFPYYIVLRDTSSLPRTLSNLLRQWFMLSS